MYSCEASCSDCKLEWIERKWTQLLLKWINCCVAATQVSHLNYKSLSEIMTKYTSEICHTDVDRAMLCTDNVEPFIKFKYPILRLRNLSEVTDIPKRLYICTSIVLYHCCMNAREGAVDEDICRGLSEAEQELLLHFCENLNDMEATRCNVEKAIRDAFKNIEMSPVDSLSDTASKSTIRGGSSGTIPTEQVKETNGALNQKDIMHLTEVDNVYYPKSSEMKRKSATSKSCHDHKRTVLSKHKISGSYPHLAKEKDTRVSGQNIKLYNVDDDDSRFEKNTEGFTQRLVKRGLFRRNIERASYDSAFYTAEPSKNPREKMSPFEAGDPGSSMSLCNEKTTGRWILDDIASKYSFIDDINDRDTVVHRKDAFHKMTWKGYSILGFVLFLIILIIIITVYMTLKPSDSTQTVRLVENKNMPRCKKSSDGAGEPNEGHSWECIKGLCQKVYDSTASRYPSFSRCSLLCMGPQIWPLPIGQTKYTNTIVALTTNRLEYNFQLLPSDTVHHYVAEAFKTFLGHLVRLEKSSESTNPDIDIPLMKLHIQILVESDPEPRIRLNTDESYNLHVETVINQLVVKISSNSFCGIRHGLETLSQMILLDQTSGKLITLSGANVKDAPCYKYRGLMIDTARNYIPMTDMIKTVDAMATVKLNTLHWRISDATSFPLFLPDLPQLFENGAYDRSMNYTKEGIISLRNRAYFRGIRILIEIAAPGPVGRPWSWSDVSCHKSKENSTCSNALCLRLNMKDSVFDVLERIYSNIIDMTKVDDMFHLSDGVFSLSNCLYLQDDKEGFLEKALFRLKQANKGFMPELPIVWYTSHLMKEYEAKTWERFGVQYNDLETAHNLSKFKVIHSAKWDLSCLTEKQRCKRYRTWQEMYSWAAWRNLEVFTIQGGEAILWTDLVGSSNLDSHIWPRAAAVAERLWSDIAINSTVSSEVYVRLDHHRWRMLFGGVSVQPVWPVWCSFNPGPCLEKKDLFLHAHYK